MCIYAIGLFDLALPSRLEIKTNLAVFSCCGCYCFYRRLAKFAKVK